MKKLLGKLLQTVTRIERIKAVEDEEKVAAISLPVKRTAYDAEEFKPAKVTSSETAAMSTTLSTFTSASYNINHYLPQ